MGYGNMEYESAKPVGWLAGIDLQNGVSWPPPAREKIYPVFLPFMGCKTRCAFCSQENQTGFSANWLAIKPQFEAAEQFFIKYGSGCKLAYYGGTFSALEERDWNYCLDFARSLKRRGLIEGFVCSTRPDRLSERRIAELAEAGCLRVELGIQSLDEKALARCGRPYDRKICAEAITHLARAKLLCCAQLMPGFPFALPQGFLEDVKTALAWGIRIFRFYPCLVFRKTALARWYSQGDYEPLGLEEAVEKTAMAWLLARFFKAKVLRMGVLLAAGEKEAVLAGPLDDAFGNRVMAAGIYKLLANNPMLRSLGKTGQEFSIFLPAFAQGYFWGWKGELKEKWKVLGITPENTVFSCENRIWLRAGKV